MAYTRESAASLQRKINAIQDTLQQIALIKEKLHKNAAQTKSDIQTAVSRQLESLRNREVWLFEQVQVLQTTKQETLDRQTDTLWQTLGNLETCLRCVTSLDGLSTSRTRHIDVNRSMEQCIARFESLDLVAKENPYLTFKADVDVLRSCIRKFGTIDTKGVMAAGLARGASERLAFSTGVHEGAACSLPRVFEDYGDAEHHVFYKPLDQAQQPGTITLKVPNANLRPQDWLFMPTDINPVPPQPQESRPCQVDVDQWLTEKQVQASPSIHQWLSDLQSQCDLEEEGYAVVTGSTRSTVHESVGSQSDIEVISHCDVTDAQREGGVLDTDGQHKSGTVDRDGRYEYFTQVLEAPSTDWLMDGNLSGLTCPYLRIKYFAEISTNLRDWLQQCGGEQEDEDRDVCCTSGRCGGATEQLDIENIDQLTCVQETQDPWLMPASKDVTAVCRANEPCETLSECVSPEHCCSDALRHRNSLPGCDKNGKASAEEWLQTTTNTAQLDAERHSHFAQIETLPDSTWLNSSNSSSSERVQDLPIFAPFQAPHEAHIWLRGAQVEKTNTDSDIWLTNMLERKSDYSEFSWLVTNNEDDKTLGDKTGDFNWLLRCIDKDKTSQVDFTAFQPANEESLVETSWLLSGHVPNTKRISKENEMSHSKLSELPEIGEGLVWLASDKLNVKAAVEQIALCGKSTALHAGHYSQWLVD